MKPCFNKIIILYFCQENERFTLAVQTRKFFYILRTDCIKDVGLLIVCKRNFHHHIDFVFTFIEIITVDSYTFIFILTVRRQLMLCFALVRSNLSILLLCWNSGLITCSNTFERAQRKFVTFCRSILFFKIWKVHYDIM
jgi:hypothetical protein